LILNKKNLLMQLIYTNRRRLGWVQWAKSPKNSLNECVFDNFAHREGNMKRAQCFREKSHTFSEF